MHSVQARQAICEGMEPSCLGLLVVYVSVAVAKGIEMRSSVFPVAMAAVVLSRLQFGFPGWKVLREVCLNPRPHSPRLRRRRAR